MIGAVPARLAAIAFGTGHAARAPIAAAPGISTRGLKTVNLAAIAIDNEVAGVNAVALVTELISNLYCDTIVEAPGAATATCTAPAFDSRLPIATSPPEVDVNDAV
jgi:hypothetical protein